MSFTFDIERDFAKVLRDTWLVGDDQSCWCAFCFNLVPYSKYIKDKAASCDHDGLCPMIKYKYLLEIK